MKIFIAISLLFYFIAFAQAESCPECLAEVGECVEECSSIESPLCWACVVIHCAECIPDCFGSVTVTDPQGIATKYCKCPKGNSLQQYHQMLKKGNHLQYHQMLKKRANKKSVQ